MKVKSSAPGKLMLFGEHAVVYGFPCIVTTVDRRLYVEVKKIEKEFKIEAPRVKDLRFAEKTVELFCRKYQLPNRVLVKIYSDFSSNFGLGSSSAVVVNLIFALSQLYNLKISKKEIFDLGYEVVLSIQGVGSGFDLAAAIYGGTNYFLTAGREIRQLPIGSLSLVVGYSGVKADTSMIVKELRRKTLNKKREIFEIFEKIKNIVEKAKIALINNQNEKIGQLMNQNHYLLQQLGVSTEKLDEMCSTALLNGAWGAKLSGAGGGDCMIALAPKEKVKDVKKAIIKAGGMIINVKNNVEGVKIEI